MGTFQNGAPGLVALSHVKRVREQGKEHVPILNHLKEQTA